MTYAINSPYEEKIIHPNGMTGNSVTHIKVDYVIGDIGVTVHNINGEVA